jgi:hypothetical protein
VFLKRNNKELEKRNGIQRIFKNLQKEGRKEGRKGVFLSASFVLFIKRRKRMSNRNSPLTCKKKIQPENGVAKLQLTNSREYQRNNSKTITNNLETKVDVSQVEEEEEFDPGQVLEPIRNVAKHLKKHAREKRILQLKKRKEVKKLLVLIVVVLCMVASVLYHLINETEISHLDFFLMVGAFAGFGSLAGVVVDGIYGIIDVRQ